MDKLYIILLIILLTVGVLSAQNAGGGASMGNSSAYTYSGTMNESDQLKILTYIWGQILRPGLYIVPDDTDVLALISLAGGPTVDAKLTEVRIVRSSSFGNEEIIIVDIKKFLDTGDYSLIPRLMPGDTIVLPGTSRYAFARMTGFIANIATILSTIILMRRI